jgi:hemerythrin-like metal-binding protein
MEIIEWDESYSVGVPELDEQHRQLFRLINDLFDAQDVTPQSQPLSDLLARMNEYAATHFQSEEKYMAETGYPDIQNHTWAHNQFRKKVEQLHADVVANRRTVSVDMQNFLYEWLSSHILSCDKDYAPLLHAR